MFQWKSAILFFVQIFTGWRSRESCEKVGRRNCIWSM